MIAVSYDWAPKAVLPGAWEHAWERCCVDRPPGHLPVPVPAFVNSSQLGMPSVRGSVFLRKIQIRLQGAS